MLGNDKFNLNLCQKLYDISLKNISNCDFVIKPDIKKRLILKKKKHKIFNNFNNINKKNLIEDYDTLINLWGSRIFTKEDLKYFKKNINIHPSYLPYWRGKNSAYYANLNQIGNGATLHEMDEKIDTPNIYIRKKLDVKYNENGFKTYLKSVKLCLEIYDRNIKDILLNKIKLKKIKYSNKKFRVFMKKEFPKNKTLILKEKGIISRFIRQSLSLDFPKNKIKVILNKQKYDLSLELKKVKI